MTDPAKIRSALAAGLCVSLRKSGGVDRRSLVSDADRAARKDRQLAFQSRTLNERFWSRVDKSGDCWAWTGSKNNWGYGYLQVSGSRIMAHRFSYQSEVAPIPDGLVLDHLCRNHACVNPRHLEPVTDRENILRGIGYSATHARAEACPSGHAYDEANTKRRRGRRYCRACEAIHHANKQRKMAERRKAAGACARCGGDKSGGPCIKCCSERLRLQANSMHAEAT